LLKSRIGPTSGTFSLQVCRPGLVEDLEEWQAGLPESKWGEAKVLIFPFSGLDTLIVALAWGWQLNLDEFDADALTEFYVRHLDRGPEDVP
jgi:hypothetical protein